MTNKRPPLLSLPVFLATWFGSGYLPKAPGTWGSIAAVPFAWGLMAFGGWPALLVASVLVTGVGIWASNGYMALSGSHDPGQIVIDEVAGQWITYLPLGVLAASDQLAWPLYLYGLFLFRVFDVIKPWPICWFDARVHGGLGVMIDDVIAGIIAAAVLYFSLPFLNGAF